MCVHLCVCMFKIGDRGDVDGNEFFTPSSFFLQLSIILTL